MKKEKLGRGQKLLYTTVVFCQFWLFYNSRMRIILYTLPGYNMSITSQQARGFTDPPLASQTKTNQTEVDYYEL